MNQNKRKINEEDQTKEQLMVAQYQAFTANERQRESSVIQLAVIIGSLVAGFGYVLINSNDIYFIPIAYSFLSISVLTWFVEHIFNSSYHFRMGQGIQSKIRDRHNNLDNVIPARWNIFENKNRPFLTNNYYAQVVLIFILIFSFATIPYLNGVVKTNQCFQNYSWYFFDSCFLVVSAIIIGLRFWHYNRILKDVLNKWNTIKP